MLRIMKSLAMLAILAALILGGSISSVAAQDSGPNGQGTKVVTPQSHACNYVSDSYRPTLRRGSTGAAVKQVQCLINIYSFYQTRLTVDGIFGPRTETAVRWNQECANIDIDGIVGPVTWNVLYNQPAGCGFRT